MLPRTPHRWLVAVALLLAFPACGLRQGAPGNGEITPGCLTDDDCLSDERCAEELGGCVLLEPGVITVSVQLTPPVDSDYALTQYADLVVDAGQALDLATPPATRVTGTVRTSNNLLEPSVAATVVARTPGSVPGTELRFDGVSRKASGGELGYELALAPAKTYEITVLLDNARFPPHRFERIFSGPEEREDFVLAELDEHPTFSGRIVSIAGSETPLGGLRVTAFATESNQVSTVAEVGVDGRFSVTVPPGEEAYRLLVDPTDRLQAIPRTVLPEPFLADGELDLGDVEIGQLPQRSELSFRLERADGAPVPGALVRCVGAINGGTLTDAEESDANGRARLILRSGQYDCVALPPPSSQAAASGWSVELTSEGPAERSIELPLRARVTGTVCDAGCLRPVSDVNVIAIHADPADPRFGEEAATMTDGSGDFALRLEPARYVVVLRPREGTGFPVTVLEDVRVEEDTELTLSLSRGVALRGFVRTPAGDPLPDVTLECFRSGNAVLDELAVATGTARSVLLLGSAVSGSDGRFLVLVAAP